MTDIIDNVNYTLAEDLKKNISKGSKISIASAYFSIYAYRELKKELERIDSLRFLFTSPTFIKEKTPARQKREFYIPRLSRERGILGTEFEVRLRNELTQKALAKECADWIRRKCEFKSRINERDMNTMLNVENGTNNIDYAPIKNFTTETLGTEHGDDISAFVMKTEGEESKKMLGLFDQIWNNPEYVEDVKETVINRLSEAYDENTPEFIYYVTLYNIFHEFLEDISEDNLPNESVGLKNTAIWNMLYSFQKDAALGIINKLETYNGCILADSVGLGKTFTALAVIKYYELKNKNVLVLCPKKLSENWNVYRNPYTDNILERDRFDYKVLYHTDLSRRKGTSNGINLGRFNWSNFDFIVIDESHNFRNGGNPYAKDIGRYDRLLKDVIEPGVKTKVLMLSATPVNNRFYDLYYQLKIACGEDDSIIENNLNADHTLDKIFRDAQAAFNKWSALEPEERTSERLLKSLDYDFFRLLDAVTIARSRKNIEKYYANDNIGKFPTRLKPINKSPGMTREDIGITYADINQTLQKLNLAIYVPSEFLLPSKRDKYGIDSDTIGIAGRERGIRRLMGINLLKRLESSVRAFLITAEKVLNRVSTTLDKIEKFKTHSSGDSNVYEDAESDEYDEDDEEDSFTEGKGQRISLEDMDYISWERFLTSDKEILIDLINSMSQITPDKDEKLQVLKETILEKVEHPINEKNRKILIFTSFGDTAEYLYDNIFGLVLEKYGMNSAMVTGNRNKCTIDSLGSNFNDILTCFSPKSKRRDLMKNISLQNIDLLIGTDCISEGQNLQDCDCCINYDIHWNPVRIIQRFGRIDRIGSNNDKIQLINFWPDVDLDSYIDLRERVEARMAASVLTSTGDDVLLGDSDKKDDDLEYRRDQLKRLKEDVVDIDDMQSGISIVDTGLNDFRIDLLDYSRKSENLDKAPFGLHAVVPSSDGIPPGIIFVLRNRVNNINEDKRNRLHPFYMVYITNNGSIVCDYLNPAKLLDIMRLTCKGKNRIYEDLCRKFNKETDDGRNMISVSKLLTVSITSVLDQKEQSELDRFFKAEDSFSTIKTRGIDDFELICFLVIR